MKLELIRLLKEKYKDNPKIRFVNGKGLDGWNVDFYNKSTRINVKISDSDVNCSMSDTRNNSDFYEFYIYKGFNDDLRKNKFIDRKYSESLSDYTSAIEVISKIIE